MLNPEMRFNRTATARAVLKATGLSPSELGEKNRQIVVDWIYQWGSTSSSIVQELLDRTSGGYAASLVKRDILVETRTAAGYFVKTFFTLSPLGLELAEKNALQLNRYPEIDPYRVNQRLLRHDLITQELTLSAWKAGLLSIFVPARCAPATGPGEKRPDTTWVLNGGLRVGMETELTGKWDRDLDDFVMGIWQAVLPTGTNAKSRFDKFILFTDSKKICERYEQAFEPGSVVRTWAKDSRGHWQVTGKRELPSEVRSKIEFKVI